MLEIGIVIFVSCTKILVNPLENFISKENLNILANDNSQTLLKAIHILLTKDINCNGDGFKAMVIQVGNDLDVKGENLFFPIRIALYGNPSGPDIPYIYSILERDETLNRIFQVIK